MAEVSKYHLRQWERRAVTLQLKAADLVNEIRERVGSGALLNRAIEVTLAVDNLHDAMDARAAPAPAASRGTVDHHHV
jgi:hypothetical protein